MEPEEQGKTSFREKLTRKVLFPALLILLIINLVVLALIQVPILRDLIGGQPSNEQSAPQPTQSTGNEEIISADPYSEPEATAAPQYTEDRLRQNGFYVIAMSDGQYRHLFAYEPESLPFVRLTNGTWDDQDPALSPDGTRIAFASHKSGYWDLYILDLVSGEWTQVTNTPEYEGSPSWSPDGQWLAYEAMTDGNLEIWIRSLVDETQAPVRLTEDAAADYSPAWSPAGSGREIAFVSTRTGNPEIWMARLDRVDDRFINLSQRIESVESNPVWSQDGNYLTWASSLEGSTRVYVWDAQNPDNAVRLVGDGSQSAWSPDNSRLLAVVEGPNQASLTAYQISNGHQVLSYTALPGSAKGILWMPGSAVDLLEQFFTTENTAAVQSPSGIGLLPSGQRNGVTRLNDVDAPYPYLSDVVVEPFNQLRSLVSEQTGWDFLAALSSAYQPLTEPPMPGIAENWLLTGRAIDVNSLPLQAGWMAIVREDCYGQVYWRVYLKARFQDGSQGAPLAQQPWDMNARFSGDPDAYENGGKLGATLDGYWIDFTDLAMRSGWKRLAALSNWRNYYPAARFGQFVYIDQLDLYQALMQLYPPEALATYTPLPTITMTPTETLIPTETRIPTRTPTFTKTPTPLFTVTPTPALGTGTPTRKP